MSTQLLTRTCHCGAIRFEVTTAIPPAMRGNRSRCGRPGAPMPPMFGAGGLRLPSGAMRLHSMSLTVAEVA